MATSSCAVGVGWQRIELQKPKPHFSLPRGQLRIGSQKSTPTRQAHVSKSKPTFSLLSLNYKPPSVKPSHGRYSSSSSPFVRNSFSRNPLCRRRDPLQGRHGRPGWRASSDSSDSQLGAVPNSSAAYYAVSDDVAVDEDEDVASSLDIDAFLDSELPSHPKVHRGVLDNGLRYVILQNRVPANRFEAHLEMHVGSVDELPHEQGLAHMIEHVTFLGSKKREKLMGYGARSNAYTDFHHTVFHVHAPLSASSQSSSSSSSSSNGGSQVALLPLVLDTLHDIAFRPQFLSGRIEKERRAILSEMQMMNTIEYRVDCQLLQSLHSENLLSQRFPIGREAQIHSWDIPTIRSFHQRWYFPANATLYIVGDIPSVPEALHHIHTYFGSEPTGYEPSPPAPSTEPITPSAPRFPFPLGLSPASNPLSFLNPFAQKSAPSAPSLPAMAAPASPPTLKSRHKIRPPVLHRWSTHNPGFTPNGYPVPPGFRTQAHIFQHELLQNFSISIFCKTPVRAVRKFRDLRNVLMQRIVLSALQFRINNRYKSGSPPFLGIDLDHSDSGREGCTVSTYTITALPGQWKGALATAVNEARRLKTFGVTGGELNRYLSALLKDSEQLAAMIDSIPSIDNLDFIMESDALGHTAMDQQQGHLCLEQVAHTVTLQEVNEVAASLLEYLADYGQALAPVPAGIVACVPSRYLAEDGREVPFEISAEEIDSVIAEGLRVHIEPEPEVSVPEHLISPEEVAQKRELLRPRFVSVDPSGTGPTRVYDPITGIIQRRLSNGIRVNMKVSENEAKGGMLRLVTAGGRSMEDPSEGGAVVVGVRTLSEGGTVGDLCREQVELFCVSHLINCVLEADEEFVCMDFHFTLRDGGLHATFQLLHMVLERSVWLEDALERAKQLYLSHYQSIPKSLERATAVRLMKAMFGGDQRFMDPNPAAIAALTLPGVRDAVMRQLKGQEGHMELNVVGDFEEEEMNAFLLDYMGTVTFQETLPGEQKDTRTPAPLRIVRTLDSSLLHQKMLLRDTDERARAYIAGPAPNRWGFTQDGKDLNVVLEPVPPTLTQEQARALAPLGVTLVEGPDGVKLWQRKRHPLYASVSLSLLSEIISARLFSTVRDTLSLTYDVSFEVSLLDRLHLGWFVVSVTSTPAKIDQALEASLRVVKGLNTNKVTQRELDRAKRTVLMRHESDLKDNGYWLGLLTHLQSDLVPRKDVGCIQDLTMLYQVATLEDVTNAYNFLSLDDDSVFTCVGIAGQHLEEQLKGALSSGNVEIVDALSGSVPLDGDQSVLAHGRGSSMTTRPTS